MDILSLAELSITLHAGALERDEYQVEAVCGSQNLALTFPDYGPTMFHKDLGMWTWCGDDLLCLAENMLSSGMWRVDMDRFQACHGLFLGDRSLPADWCSPLQSIIAARAEVGLAHALDPVSVMHLLVEHNPDIQDYLAANGVTISETTRIPLYSTAEELTLALTICLTDERCAARYADLGRFYAPYLSFVDHEWIAKAIGVLMHGRENPLVYDIGCGSGGGTITMASTLSTATFVGFERQSAHMFAEERTELPPNVTFRDVDFMLASAQAAHVCVTGAVIGHQSLEATNALVAKVHSTLEQGGYFFCCPQMEGNYGGRHRGNIAIYQKREEGFVEEERDDLIADL